VGYLVYSLDGVSFEDRYCEGAEPVYTTLPSVEAAIEATKEKAAKVCDGLGATLLDDSEGGGAFTCAEAIRSMK
jgi:hypothetical protein